MDGVDKRIDTIAVAIRMGGTIYDLKSLELVMRRPTLRPRIPSIWQGLWRKKS
jgi:hypothetical protein